VRPYGEDGAAPIIRSGEIVIDLGNDRREASIGPNGEANFKGIPGRFKETVIKVLPLVEGYKTAMAATQS